MTNGSAPPGWYRDPTGSGEARYWNGTSWTQQVSLGGRTSNVPIDPVQARQPPIPGTQVMVSPAPTYASEPPRGGSPVGPIVGVLVALLIVVLIVVIIVSSDSDDTPAPDTGVPTEAPAPATDAPEPPATDAPEAPATEAPAEGG